jgi:hypothetical protein
MYDIEVIDGHSYAIICEGSNAYEFLKAMNSKLVMKKLASEPIEGQIYLTDKEILPLCRGFRLQDLKRLVDVDLLSWKRDRQFNITTGTFFYDQGYTFTDYGLEVMKYIKEKGGDVEIPL